VNEQLIITILGAGASVKCGYPLANALFSQIGDFGSSLGNGCEHLKKAIDQVIKKADELKCTTPDELAFQIDQRLDDSWSENRHGLRTMGLSLALVSRSTGIPASRLTEITKCRRSLTAETALRLAKFFGTSAAFWIGLQSEHDLEVAERAVGARIKREVVSLAS